MAPDEALPGEHRFVLFVLLGGLALRLLWLHQVHGIGAFVGSGEATRVALALARGAGFADAFYEGYGPTAHLLPILPAIAGALIWIGGPAASNLLLLAWSLVQVGCAILLLRCLFHRLGADRPTLRWGTALLCLVTPFVSQEVVDFRYWEGASAVCLMCLNLLFLQRLDARVAIGWRAISAVAALSAVTFFVSPPVGLAVDACWAVYALRRLPPMRIVGLALTCAATLGLICGVWAWRNAAAVGHPVPLRSNFGLELALANHPAALGEAPREQVFADRLLRIHPYHSPAARAALRAAGGEVAYARGLEAQTRQWIRTDPAGFARLSLRHLGEYFFPRGWQMYFTDWEGMRDVRALMIGLVDLLGLIGLALGLLARRRGYWMLAVIVGLVALPYALVQPIPRYTWLLYGMLAFLAVETIVGLARYPRAKGPGWAR